MAADGTHDNQQPDVQKAVQAGTDLSQGSDKAFNALQSEVDAARVKYGEGTPGFNQFGHEVARGLKQGGTLEEMSEQWAKHNIDKVALSDQKHVKPDDLNPTFGHDALERAYLSSLHKNYADLQHRAGDTAFGNPKNQFSAKDFGHVIGTRQHERDHADQVRMAQDQAGREQAKTARVVGDLFKNDGDPKHSLYAVLDSIKSGKSDGKISKGDLGRYQQEYAERAGHVPPDFGFTPENLDAVRTLDREWNGPLGVSLRGTSPRVGSPREQGEQPQTNSYINLEAAAQLNGKSVDQLFASYSPQGIAQPGLRQTLGNAAGSGPDITGSQPIPNSDANAQSDAAGYLI